MTGIVSQEENSIKIDEGITYIPLPVDGNYVENIALIVLCLFTK
jgi:hypothetical protein